MKHETRNRNWTAKERARVAAIRNKYNDKPSLEELLETGDYTEPVAGHERGLPRQDCDDIDDIVE